MKHFYDGLLRIIEYNRHAIIHKNFTPYNKLSAGKTTWPKPSTY
ncbi:hypothetical protein APHCRT_0030 [Anaplasma phagocytophilum str. CRT53-1]|uniref:Uncharacterized protein n=2 Tax=Anaplasma phagocytophilum TaxID=948 RepID=A0A0F3N9V0_ANAPH|nr:hypothetical protein APHMUC_1255 [Anaplasma phagocytophilum str. ApMUC09]KJV86386.1 hypothetical protein APHNYW_1542 [Anaplasma phagocytophilum str. ApNYW]KJV88642.1 hypothetical protein APHCRT_0030 [Anaplasma phagocytophilum str. CRT53-1]